jgi:hypothetical protein
MLDAFALLGFKSAFYVGVGLAQLMAVFVHLMSDPLISASESAVNFSAGTESEPA